MNPISNLLTGLPDVDDTEVVDERSPALKAREAHLIGLRRFRLPTNGQMRRAAVRERTAAARKEAKRRTRLVLDNRQARATLQGQINLLGRTEQPTAQAYIAAHLADRYGSVEAAIQHAQKIELDVPLGAINYDLAHREVMA